MTLIALACGLLTVALFWWVFTAAPDAVVGGEHEAAVQALVERQQAVRENLRDLSFEHQAGKLNDADFARTRAMLEREVARVSARLEKLNQAP